MASHSTKTKNAPSIFTPLSPPPAYAGFFSSSSLAARRKVLPQKTSQEKFAVLLGTTRNAIASYESGKVIPSDTFIQLLCTKFNIDEHWLRTGEGEMYKNDLDAQVESFAQKYILTPDEREIMRYFFQLAPKERTAMIEHVLGVADAIRSARDAAAEEQHAAAEKQRTAPLTDEEIEAELADYRAELLAERKARSASEDGNAKRA